MNIIRQLRRQANVTQQELAQRAGTSQSTIAAYESASTNGVKALCLEIHDLWISKGIANREKDREFCAALLDRKLVYRETLLVRLKKVRGLNPESKQRLSQVIQSWVS